MSEPIKNYNTIGSLARYSAQLDISHNGMHLKSKVTSKDMDLIINSKSFYNVYFEYLINKTYAYEMTDLEYIKYRFQPKLFCLDMYGSTELWSLILKVNYLASSVDFNLKKIKMFYGDIFSTLNEILIMEQEHINENKVEIGY